MPDNLKHKIVTGVFWQGLEKVGTYGISFVISVLLARLLEPAAFGTIGLAGIFIIFSNAIIDSGLSLALIQKKDADERDYNSVFYINLIISLGILGFFLWFSPIISQFYKKPELTVILRYLAVPLVLGALGGVQRSYLCRNMLFHLNCRITWGAQVPSGILGVWMAFRGYGIWALVWQQISKSVLQSLLLWYWVQWRPKLIFDIQRLKALFKFGWKMLFCGIIGSIFNNIHGLVIGKFFNVSTFAYYQKGENLPRLGMNIINDSLGGVLLSAFSNIQDDRERLRRLFKRGISNVLFLLAPMLVLLSVISQPIVSVLFTDKWLPCVIFMQIFCISNLFTPFHATNLQVVLATGHSDYYLGIEISKKVSSIVLLVATVPFGVVPMAWGVLASSVCSIFINGFFTGRLIGYSPLQQLSDMSPFLGLAAITGIAVYFVNTCFSGNWLKIILGSIVFVICYLGIATTIRIVPEDIKHYISKIIARIRES